ncbi:Ig-like domain-containing protein, partial [Polynucleobacter alcilacus]|uniref:Ig-like domain-containing protein n=1 Tax=Polynucleobacter alcilacus TaxID=1819739 RepID=UPI001C0C2F7B
DGDTSTQHVTITITGANDSASVTVANDVLANAPDSTVYEAGLPTGSNAASNTETATGSFTVSASDGIKELVVGGTTLSLADLKTLSTLSPSSAINTGEGTLKITSYSSTDSDQNATVSYTYTLNGAQTHNQLTANTSINDGVSITVNGTGGSTASDTLTIQINDDVPTIDVSHSPITLIVSGHGCSESEDSSHNDGSSSKGDDGGESTIVSSSAQSFQSHFTVARQYNADGAGSVTPLVYTLSNASTKTDMTYNGHAITLQANSDSSQLSGITKVDGKEVTIFTVSVNSTGVVTVITDKPIDVLQQNSEKYPESDDDHGSSSAYHFSLNSIILSASASITDRDGDVARDSDSIDISQLFSIPYDTEASKASVDITAINQDTGTDGDFVTSDTSLIVSGTNSVLGDGEKIQISSDGKNWSDVSVTDATHWTYNDTGTSHNSSFTYTTRVVDFSNNIESTDTQRITIDTVASNASVHIAGINQDNGIPGDFVTNDTKLIVSGTNTTLGADEKIQISADGVAWKDVSKADNTHWTYSDNDTHNSNFTYLTRIVDLAGNIKITDSQQITIDTSGPTATIQMSDQELKIGETSTVTVTFSEAVIGFDKTDLSTPNGTLGTMSSVNGGITWTGIFTPTSNIEDTSNVISLANTYTDIAGNAGGTASSFNYGIDTKAPVPTIVISSITADNSISSTEAKGSVVVSGTVAGNFNVGDLVTLFVNGKSPTTTVGNSGVFSFTVAGADLVADPNKTIEASISTFDAAGNQGSATTSKTYNVAPVINPGTLSLKSFEDTGMSSSDGISSDKNFGIELAGNTVGSSVSYEYSTNSGTSWSSLSNATSNSNHNDGTYLYRAVVYQSGSDSVYSNVLTVVVDTNSPTPKIISGSSSSNGSVVVSSSEAGTAYLVKSSVSVTSIADITSKSHSQWDSISIAANTNTTFSKADLQSGSYKLYVADAAGNLSSAASGTVSKPIAIDLDGHGINYVGQSAGVSYDYAHNGQAVSTAWVAPNDGLLTFMTESGAFNIVFSTQVGETDLQGLAKTFDLNRDNVLDARDAQYSQFGVWQDANSDGVVETGEFLTLAQRSIQSLSLTSDGKIQLAAEGEVLISGNASYTSTDGQQHLMQDVSFASGGLVESRHDALDFAAIISQADSYQTTISLNTTNTQETNSLTFALGGELFTVATTNDQANNMNAMSHFVGVDSTSHQSGGAAWTEVVDITSDHGGPSSISAEAGAHLNNGFSNDSGDWTVIVKSGTATVDAAKHEITFTTDHTENAVTITNADGSSHDIHNVDKIAWHG